MLDIILHDKQKGLLFFLLFVVSIFLRVSYLDKSLSGDEINSVLAAKQNLGNIFSFVAKNDSYPPLQHLLLHFWLRMGDSDIWIRILYVLFGIGICPIAYLIGKEYVNSKFGLYSMFFISISPQLIHLSQYVRGIIISTFFISASIYFLIKILTGKASKLNWGGYLFSSICALYSFYFSALILIAENLYMILNWRKVKNIIRNWGISQLLIVFFFIPWMPFFARQVLQANIAHNIVASTHKGFFILGFHVGSLVRSIFGTFGLDPLFLNDVTLSKKLPFPILIIITMACFFILLMIIFRATYFFKKNTYPPKASFWFFHLLIIIPIVLAMSLRHIASFPVMSRYFAPLSIFFIFIFVGAVLSFKNRIFKILFFTILATAFISRLPAIYSPIEQWREAVSYIEKKATPGDCIVFLEKGKNDYNYYSKLNLPQFIIVKYFTRDQRSFDLVSIDAENSIKLINIIKPYEHIWVISTHTSVFGGPDVLKAWFSNNGFEKNNEKKFIGVDVALYKNKM